MSNPTPRTSVKPTELKSIKAREPLGETEEERTKRFRAEGRAADGTQMRAVSSTDVNPDDIVRHDQNVAENLSEASSREFSSSSSLIDTSGHVNAPPNSNYDVISAAQMRGQLRSDYIQAGEAWRSGTTEQKRGPQYAALPSPEALQALRNLRGAYQQIPKPNVNADVRNAADETFRFGEEVFEQEKIARQAQDPLQQKAARDAVRQAVADAEMNAKIAEAKALNGSSVDVELAKDARLVADGAKRTADRLDIDLQTTKAKLGFFTNKQGKLDLVSVFFVTVGSIGAVGVISSLAYLFGSGALKNTAAGGGSGGTSTNRTGIATGNLEMDALNTLATVEVDMVAENGLTSAEAQFVTGVHIVDASQDPPVKATLPFTAKDSSGNKIGTWNVKNNTHIVYTADTGKTGVNPVPVTYALDLTSAATAKTTTPTTLTVAFFPTAVDIVKAATDLTSNVSFPVPSGFAFLITGEAGWMFDGANTATFTPSNAKPSSPAAAAVVVMAYQLGHIGAAYGGPNQANLVVLFPPASPPAPTTPNASQTGPTPFTLPSLTVAGASWTLLDDALKPVAGNMVFDSSGQMPVGQWVLNQVATPNTITFTPLNLPLPLSIVQAGETVQFAVLYEGVTSAPATLTAKFV
jgi:hypothetical protein